MTRPIPTVLTAVLSLFLCTAAAQSEPAWTPQRALAEARSLLEAGLEQIPGGETVEVLLAWEQGFRAAGEGHLRIVSVAVRNARRSLESATFDEEQLADDLDLLAYAMRAAARDAGPDEESLLVEVASLVDQTAQRLRGSGWVPRMEVEAP